MKVPKECENAEKNARTLFVLGEIIPMCNCDNGFQISDGFSNKTSLLQQKTVITIAEKIRKTAPKGAVLDVL